MHATAVALSLAVYVPQNHLGIHVNSPGDLLQAADAAPLKKIGYVNHISRRASMHFSVRKYSDKIEMDTMSSRSRALQSRHRVLSDIPSVEHADASTQGTNTQSQSEDAGSAKCT